MAKDEYKLDKDEKAKFAGLVEARKMAMELLGTKEPTTEEVNGCYYRAFDWDNEDAIELSVGQLFEARNLACKVFETMAPSSAQIFLAYDVVFEGDEDEDEDDDE